MQSEIASARRYSFLLTTHSITALTFGSLPIVKLPTRYLVDAPVATFQIPFDGAGGAWRCSCSSWRQQVALSSGRHLIRTKDDCLRSAMPPVPRRDECAAQKAELMVASVVLVGDVCRAVTTKS